MNGGLVGTAELKMINKYLLLLANPICSTDSLLLFRGSEAKVKEDYATGPRNVETDTTNPGRNQIDIE